VGGVLHISAAVSAGGLGRLRALVSIYFVIGYVKGMKGPQLEGMD
jgi:hypothetical protein